MRRSTPEFVAKEQFAKFGAATEEDYQKKLRAMNDSDFQRHGHLFNIRTSYNRKHAERTLVGFFKAAKSKLRGALTPQNIQTFTPEQIRTRQEIIGKLPQ